MKESFIIESHIDASWNPYYHERLNREALDIETIMLHAKMNGFNFLDGQGSNIDYSDAVDQARKNNQKSKKFDMHLKIKGYKVRVNFSKGKIDEKRQLYGGMDLILYPLGEIYWRKFSGEGEGLDLVFYVNIFIALSEGFMIEFLDAIKIEAK